MRFNITNCKDPLVEELLRRGLHFYAKQLFPRKGHVGLTTKVVLVEDNTEGYADEPEQGSCEVTHFDENWKPINFEIVLLKTDLRTLMYNAAHEMVHVEQFRSRSISGNLDSWKGKKLHRGSDYWSEPWEIEAYGMETGLFNKFYTHYDLKDFFIEHSRWLRVKPKQTY